jgi:hypothetical protein
MQVSVLGLVAGTCTNNGGGGMAMMASLDLGGIVGNNVN